jgi:hypothetical protein
MGHPQKEHSGIWCAAWASLRSFPERTWHASLRGFTVRLAIRQCCATGLQRWSYCWAALSSRQRIWGGRHAGCVPGWPSLPSCLPSRLPRHCEGQLRIRPDSRWWRPAQRWKQCKKMRVQRCRPAQKRVAPATRRRPILQGPRARPGSQKRAKLAVQVRIAAGASRW